ncbi:MAG: hypothetical protein ACOX6V_01515 [Patescibacteria group bacterium]|jgi:hypothetical protein
MLEIIVVLLQIFLLYLLATKLQKKIFVLGFLLTKSKKFATSITSILLLPGTIIHEVSHWLAAELLGVPTGEMNLMPRFEEGLGIKMGSIQVAKTDFVRRTLVGLAPLVMGLFIIVLAAHFLSFPTWERFSPLTDIPLILSIFLVSNTMFSSAKDLEAAFPFFTVLAITIFALNYFNVPVPIKVSNAVFTLTPKFLVSFTFAIAIDLFFYATAIFLTKISEKITKRKIIIQ